MPARVRRRSPALARRRAAAGCWMRRFCAVKARLLRLPRAEEGTIAQATLLAMLGCVLAIGLVGNVARVTHQKVEVQNSADATAHAVAAWHARSLNAVTATNHLIGELTAICVLQEAFGGPELDAGDKFTNDEMRRLDQLISAPDRSFVANDYFPPEEPLIQYIQEQICNKGKHPGETTAGAALYDARIALKQWIWSAFTAKLVADLLIKVKVLPPVVVVGMVMHFVATGVLVKCTSEWLLMEHVVEPVAKGMKIPKKTLQEAVIPLLCAYQSLLAQDSPAAGGGVVEAALKKTIQQLDQANRVQSKYFREALPIEREAAPASSGAGGEIRSQSIRTTDLPPAQIFIESLQPLREMAQALNRVAEFLGEDEVDLEQLMLPPRSKPDVSQDNPTIDKYEKLPANWEVESKTQWTRAAQPWVHSGRARLMGLFDQPLALTFARMPTFYGHWTSRLTMVKAYELRSGRRMGGGAASPQTLYVLKDFDANQKGREDWTRRDGSRTAERYFTNMGFSRREATPLFSPAVFGDANYTQYGFAQAIVYNANQPKDFGGGDRQPVVGWDTLNWRPGAPITEFGAMPVKAAGSPSDLVDALLGRNFHAPPPIRLHWQPKLVPATESRLRDAVQSPRLDGSLRQAMSKVLRVLRSLNTH